ncbi:MAG: protein translocase subunit SecD [Rickettsiales bacterium]|jgi:protein-export membrane protein SecD|nr:protein translocase subunit SecD [Rickettsiales bacterium]
MFKKLLIIATAVFGCLLVVPTVFPGAGAFLPSFIQPIPLGLDLKGGAHLLMAVDSDAMAKEQSDALLAGVRAAMVSRDKGLIRFSDLKEKGGSVSLVVRDDKEVSAARGRIRSEFGESVDIKYNGNKIEVSFSAKAREQKLSDAIDRSIEIIRRRIDAIGTKEPSIQRQGSQYILVQLPGVDNPERIKELIGKTAKMSFHLVNEKVSPEQLRAGRAPAGTEFLPYLENPGQFVPVFSRVEVSGESLTDSRASFDQSTNMPVVTTVFDGVGARRFAKLTTQHVEERFAIVLDGQVLSAPVIREPIVGGRGQISGGFTLQGAKDLAVLLRSGALPAPLIVVEERTIGPGLGEDSIRAGKLAAALGSLFIMLFMVLVYRRFGIFANFVLVVNLAMLVGLLALFGTTLTLPGIAGIVLTLGMAVDANILQYERARDEMRQGASSLRAIDAGFKRAHKAILDANLTTLICSLVLFQFGSGPIKGFAVVMSVGVFTTLFTCVPLARLVIDAYMNGKNKRLDFVRDAAQKKEF